MQELEDLKHLAKLLTHKIEDLEQWLKSSEITPKGASKDEKKPQEKVLAGIPAKTPPSSPIANVSNYLKKRKKPDWETFFGKYFMPVMGVIVLIFAVGWFLKYSFEKNLIPPFMRVILGYGFSIFLALGGEFFRRRKTPFFGYSLMGGGIAGFYFSTFAAHQIYHLISIFPAVVILFAVTALAIGLSLYYDTKWLAALGAFGGFLTPLFFRIEISPYILFAYVLLLNVGLLYISFHKSWRLLASLGFFFSWLIWGVWHAKYFESQFFWIAIAYINVTFLIYSIVPYAHQLKGKSFRKTPNLLMLLSNATLALSFNYYYIIKEYSKVEVSFVTILYSFYFIFLASQLFKKGQQEKPVFSYFLLMAFFFVAVTIPLAFSDQWITISWMILAAALCWFGHRLKDKKVLVLSGLIGGAGLIHLFSSDLESLAYHSRKWWYFRDYAKSNIKTILFMKRMILYVSFVGSLCFSGYLFFQNKKNEKSSAANIYYSMAFFLFFYFVNIEVSHFFNWFHPKMVFASITILWSLFTLAMMIFGIIKKIAALRSVAIILFLFTIVKLFFVDLPRYREPFYLVIDFAFVGIPILMTALLFTKFKDRLEEFYGNR